MTQRLLPAALAGLVLAALPAQAQDAPSFFDGADPDFEVAEGQYWLYPTLGDKTLVAWHALDMQKWKRGPVLLDLGMIPWINDDHAPRHHLWAPDMVRVDGRYYLYYSTGPQNPTPSRIAVAVCESPAGPCKDSGKPLVNDGGHGFEATRRCSPIRKAGRPISMRAAARARRCVSGCSSPTWSRSTMK